ncbi:hypothetical protein PHYC_03380 [Phycisphaerales bacterium]|nr:hypothetical protein PHYC_03380 [Phycisphaerales bacterium]
MLCPGDARLVAREPALSALATLLDPEALAAIVTRRSGVSVTHATPTYLRYKPATSCLVAYELQIAGRASPLAVYARTHAGDAASVKIDNAVRQPAWSGPLGPGIFAVDDPPLTLFTFPNDHELDVLPRLHDPAELSRLLGKASKDLRGRDFGPLEQLRYKPERRFAGRATAADGESFFIKAYAPANAGPAIAGARAFEPRGSLQLARFLGGYARRGVAAWEWLRGRPIDLHTRSEGLSHSCARVGEALAMLHHQPALVPDAYAPTRLAEILAESIAAIHAIAPNAISRLHRLASRLEDWVAPAQLSPLHGDFSPGQVLLSEAAVAILDFDRAGRGPADLDLGNFIANVELLALLGEAPPTAPGACADSLVQGYFGAGAPTQAGIHVRTRPATAFALMRLAPEPFRTRRADWPELLEAILTRAEVLLDPA